MLLRGNLAPLKDNTRIFVILRGCPRYLITDLNPEPLTESRHHHWYGNSNAHHSATEKPFDAAYLDGGVYFSDGAPRKKERKMHRELRFEPASRDWLADTLTSDHSPTMPCWHQAQTYAIRTKRGSFMGGNESPQTSTAPELHLGESKVMSMHPIGNLKSAPPFKSINLLVLC